jgi:curli biogenesis system outer membrane secretion channel CsgG
MTRSHAVASCLVLLVAVTSPHIARAQDSTANAGATVDEAFRAIPRAQRPRMAVQGFEFSAQMSREDQDDLNSYGAFFAALRGGNPQSRTESNMANLAKATTQLLTERLQNTQQFRVFEREQLGTVIAEQDLGASSRAKSGQTTAQTGEILTARYVVTGAITKFGKSTKKKNGAVGAVLGRFGGGVRMSSGATDYEVGLTVKVVESSTGEVIASATTDGVVTGDTERSLGGIGGTWGAVAGGAFGKSATGEREKRVSEALQRAIDLVVLQLVAARRRGDIEP